MTLSQYASNDRQLGEEVKQAILKSTKQIKKKKRSKRSKPSKKSKPVQPPGDISLSDIFVETSQSSQHSRGDSSHALVDEPPIDQRSIKALSYFQNGLLVALQDDDEISDNPQPLVLDRYLCK